jgi:Ca-activated chloride channel family protein
MIPHGWDFNAVAGEQRNQPVQHAALDRALLDRLAVSAPPGTPDATENSDGLDLPATATPRELLMIAGALLMLLGFLWLLMNRERRLW